MIENPLFSVLIVLFHEPLNTIEENICKNPFESIEYIIVDNSESNEYFNSVIKWKNQLDSSFRQKIKIIQAEKDGGYTKGNNIGFRYSKGKYLLILNPDMKIGPDFLSNANKIFEKEDWSIISPKVYFNFEEKRIRNANFIYTKYSPINIVKNPKSKQIDDKRDTSSYNTFYADGGCFLIRREVFKELRGFDENFFMYNDETDLCERARKRGHKIVYCPLLTAAHLRNEEYTLFTWKYHFQNILNFSGKFSNIFEFLTQVLLSFPRVFIVLIDFRHNLKCKYSYIIPILKYIKHGLIMGLQYKLLKINI